jgi:hypothetical protein
MVNEVESILNEIRERVHADHPETNQTIARAGTEESITSSGIQPRTESSALDTESLGRLSAYLTTTARAWDRLPPLYSNRTGGAARIELWLKARLKSMSRWFTWEQVNFNAAAHHALSETLHALSAQQQELGAIRAELRRDTEAWRERLERGERELSALRTSIDSLSAEARKRDANQEALNLALNERSVKIESWSANLEARNAKLETHSATVDERIAEAAALLTKEMEATRELAARLIELGLELRESDQQLREEQRVCFKQLSLEASETAVMEDRARRAIDSRLDELQKAVSDGEPKTGSAGKGR